MRQQTLAALCRQRKLIGQLAREIGASAHSQLAGISEMELSQKIRDMLQRGGPVLLVLDDLWSEHQASQLLGTSGDPALPLGSQLLLTSRSSAAMAAYNPMPMELLSDADALALLARHACGHDSLPAHLAEIAKDGLRTCGGLPLAVKTLGGALRLQAATQEAWKVSSACLLSTCIRIHWHARMPFLRHTSDDQQTVASQAKVAAFKLSAANGVVVDDKSMSQWLATSFWSLATDRHRQIFLDAATVLRGQLLQDLRWAWTAAVQLDDDCADDPGAAASIVESCLVELKTSSLVGISSGTDAKTCWADVQLRYDIAVSLSSSAGSFPLPHFSMHAHMPRDAGCGFTHYRDQLSQIAADGTVTRALQLYAGSAFTTVYRQWHTSCHRVARKWLAGR